MPEQIISALKPEVGDQLPIQNKLPAGKNLKIIS